MPRGNWRIVFAAIGLLAAPLAAKEQPTREKPQANAAAQQTDSDPNASINYRPYASRESDDCYQQRNHDSADLCAQWRAAVAAEKAAQATELADYIAGGGAALSALSLILVVIALAQGREANRIARDNSAAQLRAYMTLGAINPHPVKEGGDDLWRIQVEWTNTGDTPAREVAISTVIVPRMNKIVKDFTPILVGPDNRLSEVGSGRPAYQMADLKIKVKDFPLIADEKVFLYLISQISYRDVFGISHLSRIAVYLQLRPIEESDPSNIHYQVQWPSVPLDWVYAAYEHGKHGKEADHLTAALMRLYGRTANDDSRQHARG